MKEFSETTVSATEAFEQQLKTLCIEEFPCGFGTWREPEKLSNASIKSSTIYRAQPVISQTDVIRLNAQHESVEDLKELALMAPYQVDYSWSNEAKELREIAVTTPEKLNHNFILKHFKSLRIVDKKVSEIDEGLLQFQNLKQLTLSANQITEVNSKRLPKELEELELSANRITNIGLLCTEPPPLIHLGLGYNLISTINGYIKSNAWENLLSLDLSSNNLCDLVATVAVLKTLPKLRNLLLAGNPLVLSAGYRGYTVDSIRHLTILDDLRISADEKHHFRGLAKLKEIPLDEAVVIISIPTVEGVKMPVQAEDSEVQSEYPKIEYKYCVKFRFLKSTLVGEEVAMQSPALSLPAISVVSPDGESEKLEDNQRPSQLSVAETTVEEDIFQMVKTAEQPWSENAIELNYSERFHTKFFMSLRDFIKEGIVFSVIETKHSYVLEDPNAQSGENRDANSPKSRPTSKSEKQKKSANKDKEKDKGKGKSKESKGKGKQDDVELFELPPQQRTLGSCFIPLITLIEGDHVIDTKSVCTLTEPAGDTEKAHEGAAGKAGTPTGKAANTSDRKKNTKGDVSEKGVKGHRASTPGKAKGGKEGKGKSSKDEKGGKNKQQDESQEMNEEDNIPPPPLALHVRITLHNWKSAREAAVECSTRPSTALK